MYEVWIVGEWEMDTLKATFKTLEEAEACITALKAEYPQRDDEDFYIEEV